MDALQVAGLTKTYRTFELGDVGFSLPAGFVMGLVGPNGAGKKTVMRLILNLAPRKGGVVTVFGHDAVAEEQAAKELIGFVFDEPRFHEDVSLQTVKTAHGRFYPSWDEGLFSQLADEFQLSLRGTYKKLSLGNRTKFALALALAHRPRLLIMDEPTAGLDPGFRRLLLNRLREFVAAGDRSVLSSTHITTDLDAIADYVTFIHRGRVAFTAGMDVIADSWAVVRGPDADVQRLAPASLLGTTQGAYSTEALTQHAPQLRASLPSTCVAEPASLEEIMYLLDREARR